MIDFDIPAELVAQRDAIRAFVNYKIVPYETDPRLTRHGPDDELRSELVELAREAGLLTFQAPRRFGGREPSHREQAVLFEAAGRTPLPRAAKVALAQTLIAEIAKRLPDTGILS